MSFFMRVLLVSVVLAVALLSGPTLTGERLKARERAAALLRQMTLEEKIGQLNLPFLFESSAAVDELIAQGGAGAFVMFHPTAAETNRLQRIAVEKSRLHIPLLLGMDVMHGFRTVFPVPIGMAAAWDPGMVEQLQSIAAAEARAEGLHLTFGPMVDIARDARWGRMVEGAGEDPYLGAAIAAAQVRGFQGPRRGTPHRLLACVKHFAGYGAAEGGRDIEAANVPESGMWNIYLPPFRAAVDADVAAVMTAYHDLNDLPATANRWLLDHVLRAAWGFDGVLLTDGNTIQQLVSHGFAADAPDAAVRALRAGVNLEMASHVFQDQLAALVRKELVTVAQIDRAVMPVLEAKFLLGLFEHPYVEESAGRSPRRRDEARRAAESAAVLLRNEGNLLPLEASVVKRIAVIGPLADSKRDILGPWSFGAMPVEAVTILEGLRARLGPRAQLDYAPALQIRRGIASQVDPYKEDAPWTEARARAEMEKALSLARDSELVILVLGEAANMSGEDASRWSLELPGRQGELLDAVASLGKPVVLVLMNGRPLDLSRAVASVPAILECWYPGMEGGAAVANLLFGDANPGGKLPITWPRNVGQLPIYYAHNATHDPGRSAKRYWDGDSSPLYPFGYGLSYTSFRFSNLRLASEVVPAGGTVEVSVDVENTGKWAGDEVVQFYIHQRFGTASRPVRELKGFRRIHLMPGEKSTVRFSLGPAQRAYWNSESREWTNDAASFDVWVGADSTAELHAQFAVR